MKVTLTNQIAVQCQYTAILTAQKLEERVVERSERWLRHERQGR
jgi:hypothetical protein